MVTEFFSSTARKKISQTSGFSYSSFIAQQQHASKQQQQQSKFYNYLLFVQRKNFLPLGSGFLIGYSILSSVVCVDGQAKSCRLADGQMKRSERIVIASNNAVQTCT